MIVLHSAMERRHLRRDDTEVWTHFAPPNGNSVTGFGPMAIFDEEFLRPGAIFHSTIRDIETLVYVIEGALEYVEGTGRSGILRSGEFLSVTGGVAHNEINASPTEWARVFRIGFRRRDVLPPVLESRRFTVAERRGRLCVVASRDGRNGSLQIAADALIHSALLESGQHVVHELVGGRSAWVHVVSGSLSLAGNALSAADGATVSTEQAVGLTAREACEVLLFDVPEELPMLRGDNSNTGLNGRRTIQR